MFTIQYVCLLLISPSDISADFLYFFFPFTSFIVFKFEELVGKNKINELI